MKMSCWLWVSQNTVVYFCTFMEPCAQNALLSQIIHFHFWTYWWIAITWLSLCSFLTPSPSLFTPSALLAHSELTRALYCPSSVEVHYWSSLLSLSPYEEAHTFIQHSCVLYQSDIFSLTSLLKGSYLLSKVFLTCFQVRFGRNDALN